MCCFWRDSGWRDFGRRDFDWSDFLVYPIQTYMCMSLHQNQLSFLKSVVSSAEMFFIKYSYMRTPPFYSHHKLLSIVLHFEEQWPTVNYGYGCRGWDNAIVVELGAEAGPLLSYGLLRLWRLLLRLGHCSATACYGYGLGSLTVPTPGSNIKGNQLSPLIFCYVENTISDCGSILWEKMVLFLNKQATASYG